MPNVKTQAPPRIEYLKVENFRALKTVVFKDLTPMTVLLGPNGSGKSTVFDVFAFLADCFESGLRRAWDRRGRGKQLRTRGSNGQVTIEIKYRERSGKPKTPLTTYHLSVDEDRGMPMVTHEWLRWKPHSYGAPFVFLDYRRGSGRVAGGEAPGNQDDRVEIPLSSPDLLAVNALGQLREHPRVAALRDFIIGWQVSYLSSDRARGRPEAGPYDQLSKTGDNLATVIQFLAEQHPERLERIVGALRGRIPRVERLLTKAMPNGRSLLQIKDAPFNKPVLARFASEGTLKMLGYLVLMFDPDPPPLIGIEEPESFLHPQLLYGLAGECRGAGERTQLLVSTHSPLFVNALRPEEVRILWRDESGYTQTEHLADRPGVKEFMTEGAQLGSLWMEGFLGLGDPLTQQGAPSSGSSRVR